MPKVINRQIFFAKVRNKPFNGRLTNLQKQGMDYILDVWETNFVKRTPISQFAYCLGTACWETARTMQPIHEQGSNAYFTRMYDIKGSRPKKAKELGNIYPGDGIKFAGMGLVQSTGRSNARKATKRLRELGLIDATIDFEKDPKLLMVPRLAAMVMFIGMEEGWFTGRTLDKIIDNDVDGDEHEDYVRARAIINGTDKAEAIADFADDFLEALVAATASDALSDEDKSIVNNKGITGSVSIEDVDAEEPMIPAAAASKKISLNRFEIKGVQQQLWNLGYVMVGKPDGIWGANTSAAVSALQKQVGLEVTGGYNEDVKDALNDKSNKYIPSPARANATVATVRASGSRIIEGSDGVKSTSKVAGTGFGIMTAGSALVSYAPDAISWLSPIKEFFGDIPIWIYGIMALIVCGVLWYQANKIEKARVEDERTGKTLGSPTVVNDDEDIDVIDTANPPAPEFLTKQKHDRAKNA